MAAPQMAGLPDRLYTMFITMRKWATSAGAHRRQPEAIASLLVGYSLMLQYFIHAGLKIDAKAMLDEAQRIILDHSEAQAITLKEENPVKMFFDALEELCITHRAKAFCIAALPSGAMEDVIAFIDQKYIYLLPGVSYGKVQEFYRGQDTSFPIRQGELWKRLAHQGIIATWGKSNTKTKHIPSIGTDRYLWMHIEKSGTLFSKVEQGA